MKQNFSFTPDEANQLLKILEIEASRNALKIANGKYDFKNAKTDLMFCNGAWCGQSPEAMKALTPIGYTEEKLKW